MQNSTLNYRKNVVVKIQLFIYKLKTAYRFVRAPKAFIVINQEIKAFNVSIDQVGITCGTINGAISMRQVQTQDAKNTKMVYDLIHAN